MHNYSVKYIRKYEITIQVRGNNEQEAIEAAQNILEDEDVDMSLSDEYVEKVVKE